MTGAGDGADRPLLRVVRGGDLGAEELAALVTAVVARAVATAPAPAPARRVGGWAARGQAVRRPLQPGPGAWVASTRPH